MNFFKTRHSVRLAFIPFILLVNSSFAADKSVAVNALNKSIQGVAWNSNMSQQADFNCDGKKDWAFLGKTKKEIVIAVVLAPISANSKVERVQLISNEIDGLTRPELTLESLDYDPRKMAGDIPGFQRSKTCSGLNFSPGETDTFHFFWDHQSGHLNYWRL